MTLRYLYENHTYHSIGAEYGILLYEIFVQLKIF